MLTGLEEQGPAQINLRGRYTDAGFGKFDKIYSLLVRQFYSTSDRSRIIWMMDDQVLAQDGVYD